MTDDLDKSYSVPGESRLYQHRVLLLTLAKSPSAFLMMQT
jgi:hypothetical protein